MKKPKPTPVMPEPSSAEVQDALPKSETIHLRVTKAEKADVRVAASGLHLSITDYLLGCHRVVAAKLRPQR